MDSFELTFGIDHLLPIPTNCCWLLLNKSDEWNHTSAFLVLEVGMAYDLSSKILPSNGQYDATFYSNLYKCCTRAPFWVNKDDSVEPIICPRDGFYNLAWGRGGGSSQQQVAQKKAGERNAHVSKQTKT